MTDPIVDWKRFWTPRTAAISFHDGGYLVDPETEAGRAFNRDVVPFSIIANHQCLVLLGEPGIGKTTAMASLRNEIEGLIAQRGERSLWLNLNECGQESTLYRELFDSPRYKEWLAGSFTLHLFLDSLDECLLRIDTVANVLLKRLSEAPLGRLRFRIACRTAEWPHLLEVGLGKLFSDKAVGYYELVPLRKVDVIAAAQAWALDANLFLSEVERRDAKAFAIKPVTLFLLLKLFRAHAGLPATKLELFREGCKTLASEPSDSRKAAKLTGNLDPLQRLLIARRIAALMMLARRSAIHLDPVPGGCTAEDVTLEDICGGFESEDQVRVDVVGAAVREVLDTGLFSSRGPNRLGWAHQTYMEFLASQFLTTGRFAEAQVASLLMHASDPNRVVPQLHELASWVATADQGLFTRILKGDPQVLVRSDVEAMDAHQKRDVVVSLLERLSGGALAFEWGLSRYYRRLEYPTLASDLRAYLTDTSRGIAARLAAIQIAEECKLNDVQDALLRIATDASDDRTVRESAISAIGIVGDKTTRLHLRSLAERPENDVDDRLKTAALEVLWPEFVTADFLFHCLTPPQNASHFGAYFSFAHRAMKKLKEADIPRALEWVASLPPHYRPDSYFEYAADEILRRAWTLLDDESILGAFATAALHRLRQHDGLFRRDDDRDNPIRRDQERRRSVVAAVIRLIAERQTDAAAGPSGVFNPIHLIFEPRALVFDDDLAWLLECFLAASAEEKSSWLSVITGLLNVSLYGKRSLDPLLDAVAEHPQLASEFKGWFEPIEIDSDQARQLKARHEEWRRQVEFPQRAAPDPPVAELIQRSLNLCEGGELASYVELQSLLSLDEMGLQRVFEDRSDVMTYPGWKTSDELTRERIGAASKRYLCEYDFKADSWLGKDVFDDSACAAYRALQLVWSLDPGWLESASEQLWTRWAEIVVGVRGVGTLPKEVVQVTYARAPEAVVRTMLTIIDAEDRQEQRISVVARLIHCWDQRMERALVGKVQDTSLSPLTIGDLLQLLVERQNEAALRFAISLIPSPVPTTEPARALALEAAVALLAYAPAAGWDAVWSAMTTDDAFGRDIVRRLSSHPYENRKATLAARLREDQVADLYLWVTERYPEKEDPNTRRGRVVTQRDNIGRYRDLILRTLQERGTQEAVVAVKRIAGRLPDVDFTFVVLHTSSTTLRQTWSPPAPREILALAVDANRRLVMSGEQLIQVVQESLARLQQQLHGEIPEVRFLWDRQKGPPESWIPVEEATLSDYIARHLILDLRRSAIVVNREVEIRRIMGGAPGEATDIHVTALARRTGDEFDRIKLIIEAKGCWNRDVKKDMNDQLKKRYLQENDCRHGLYLVGWFNCPQWDSTDYRRGDAPSWSASEATAHFASQAGSVSDETAVIEAVVLDCHLR